MRDRLRSFDSKITFFAFADIITAVSGMLIFITLLLATDLGRPSDNRSQAANAELQRQLQETLTKQAEVDAETRGLQHLLTTANTAPPPEKLESDISRLRAELANEKNKHSGLAEQLAASKSNLAERDKLMGVTALKERLQESAEELQAMAGTNATIRDQTAALEKQIAIVQSKILKLRAREGQVWLIPDSRTKSKEPILAVVSASGLTLARFDQPDETRTYKKGEERSGLESYLKRFNPANQYVVFLIRPSGVGLFKDLVEKAKADGFEVGFDALEEDREIHFTKPPPIDDQIVPAGSGRGTAANTNRMYGSGSTGSAGTYTPGGAGGTSGTGPNTGPYKPGGAYTPGGTGATSGTDVAGGGTDTTGGGTSEIGGGTNTVGGGTNTVDGGTNLVGGGTNSISGGGTNTGGGGTNISANASKTNSPGSPPPPPKPKNWWQRLLEWLGIG
jgi:hypothetical protein